VQLCLSGDVYKQFETGSIPVFAIPSKVAACSHGRSNSTLTRVQMAFTDGWDLVAQSCQYDGRAIFKRRGPN
jgi:hypothetical protein